MRTLILTQASFSSLHHQRHPLSSHQPHDRPCDARPVILKRRRRSCRRSSHRLDLLFPFFASAPSFSTPPRHQPLGRASARPANTPPRVLPSATPRHRHRSPPPASPRHPATVDTPLSSSFFYARVTNETKSPAAATKTPLCPRLRLAGGDAGGDFLSSLLLRFNLCLGVNDWETDSDLGVNDCSRFFSFFFVFMQMRDEDGDELSPSCWFGVRVGCGVEWDAAGLEWRTGLRLK